MEGNGKKNNGENSSPLTSLQVDRLTATDCNAAARANKNNNKNRHQHFIRRDGTTYDLENSFKSQNEWKVTTTTVRKTYIDTTCVLVIVLILALVILS